MTIDHARPRTLGELRQSGYRSRSVKDEMRGNLIARLASGEPILPGIVGDDETVIPAVENAVLAGQDIVFLGERGQGKTRMARQLVGLLDESIPVFAGSELRDDPFAPVTAAARERVSVDRDATLVDWVPSERLYGVKIAKSDITIADLIG